MSALTGKGSQKQHTYLYWEFHYDGGKGPWSVALRSGDWKVVRDNFREADYMDHLELYDISEGIEPVDKSAVNPEKLEELKTLMSGIREVSPAFPFPAD